MTDASGPRGYAPSMRILALVLAAAALPGCYTDCHPKARPSLSIGTGEFAYEPLDPADPTWTLVHGPQGGWHVLLGFEAHGLDATNVVVAETRGYIDDELVAANDSAWLAFTCEEASSAEADDYASSLQAKNLFLIFNVETHCGLDGQMLHVEATLPDSDGEPVTASMDGRIVDPEAGACE